MKQSPSDKKAGEFTFSRKGGGSSFVRLAKKGGKMDMLKSKQSDFASAPVSTDITKIEWKANGWRMHLVIRSFENELVATFCGEGKNDSILGTTYFPSPLDKDSIAQIKSFYDSL